MNIMIWWFREGHPIMVSITDVGSKIEYTALSLLWTSAIEHIPHKLLLTNNFNPVK